MKNELKIALTTVAFIVIGEITISLKPWVSINPGHVGVVSNFGSVSDQPLQPGLNFKNPLSTIYEVDTRISKSELSGANASTKDLQVVHTTMVLNYKLDSKKVVEVFKEYGLDLEDKVLMPIANEAFKSVVAKYNSVELVERRAEVSSEIAKTIREKVEKYGLLITDISLVNFGFSPEYEEAIEQKVVATQKKQKAEQDLERVKVEAQSRIEQARGEAEAIKVQSEAVQKNGGFEYVMLQGIQKWDGKLPTSVYGQLPTLTSQVSK